MSASISSAHRGEWAEAQACRALQKLGFKLKAQRKKIGGIEIDLIFWKEAWLLIEVKSLSCESRLPNRVSRVQVRRLLLALEIFQQRVQAPVVLGVVYVSNHRMRFLRIEDHLQETSSSRG